MWPPCVWCAHIAHETPQPTNPTVQIRVGDFVFKDAKSEGRIQLDDYMDFFDCAKEIEEHKTRSNQTKASLV